MDAPSLGVLRDTALLVWIALLFGVLGNWIVMNGISAPPQHARQLWIISASSFA
jgi:hypothetical protein